MGVFELPFLLGNIQGMVIMIEQMRTVVYTDECGLETSGIIGFGSDCSTIWSGTNILAPIPSNTIHKLNVLPNGTVITGDRVLSSRELLELGSDVFTQIKDALRMAIKIGVVVNVDLTENNTDAAINNGRIAIGI